MGAVGLSKDEAAQVVANIEASQRMVEGERGVGASTQPQQGEASWLSFSAWFGWVDDLLINGSNFFYGMMHGILFGRPVEKVIDGRKVKIQTPGLWPPDGDTASARGQNAVLLSAGGWLYYGPTFAYSIAEGLWGEIRGLLWDLPWAVYDGSLMQALKLGMDALFSDANTAFFFGRDMGADMIRDLGDAMVGPLKGLVAEVGKLLGSLLPDIVGAIFSGGGSLFVRGGMKFATKSAKLAPELLEYLAKRASRSRIDLREGLERAAKTKEPLPAGSMDGPKIKLPDNVKPLDEGLDTRATSGRGTDGQRNGTNDPSPEPARLELHRPDKPPGEPAKVNNPRNKAELATRRLRWLDDAIRKHDLNFDQDTLDFLKQIYRSHEKLELDKSTIKEIAALQKNRKHGDLLAQRAAQGELDTLKFLNDDPLTGRIRMVRQTTLTRTPDFEVTLKSGPSTGELRQVEVRTLTRTGWKDGKRIDRMHQALRQSAARFAAYSKMRRSKMPKHVDDSKKLRPEDRFTHSEYLYKTQIFDRGFVSVQIAGDIGDAVPLSAHDIKLLKKALSRHSPLKMTDADGVTRTFPPGELANIEGVWVHYVSNGVSKVQKVMNPDIDV